MTQTGSGDWAPRQYRLGFAMITDSGLFSGDLERALPSSWKPGATVTRYRRRWYLSKPHSAGEGFLAGDIGFVRDGDVTTVSFDPGLQEFRRETASSGSISPFVVRLSDGLVVYQLRPGVIREHTFTGALEDLLNSSPTEHMWSVMPATELVEWPVWRESVDTVTSFKFRLERPNPHYGDDFRVEEIVTDLNARVVLLGAKAEQDKSLDTGDELFQQALDHVLRNYGSATVVGQAEAAESVWTRPKNSVGQVSRRKTVEGTGRDEAPVELLQQVAASEHDDFTAQYVQVEDELDEDV